eukprot:4439023-Ditylum_brightwellii.AAC.1
MTIAAIKKPKLALLLLHLLFLPLIYTKVNDELVVSAFTFLPQKNIHNHRYQRTTTITTSSTKSASESSQNQQEEGEQPYNNCVPDPRKEENLEKGRKTLWANIGAHQLHLPEGKPSAQVLDGAITLVYPSLDNLVDRSKDEEIANILDDSLFH